MEFPREKLNDNVIRQNFTKKLKEKVKKNLKKSSKSHCRPSCCFLLAEKSPKKTRFCKWKSWSDEGN